MGLPAIYEGDLRLIKTEPRIQDIRLAEALEFARPRDIRQLIERNLNELAGYSEICGVTPQNDDPQGRGRPGKEYWLTEEQALLICMRSDAPRAKEIRAEIIAVFQAWRHGHLVPKNTAPVTLDAIGTLFKRELDPLRQDIARVDERVAKTEGNITFLASRIDDIVPRRDFPKDVTRQWRHVLVRRYNGECPCCRANVIVDTNGNPISGLTYDHFRGRELNGPEDGWPVCTKCNLKLRDAEFKNASRKHFEVFQDYRRALCAGHPSKRRNGSDDSQPRLL